MARVGFQKGKITLLLMCILGWPQGSPMCAASGWPEGWSCYFWTSFVTKVMPVIPVSPSVRQHHFRSQKAISKAKIGESTEIMGFQGIIISTNAQSNALSFPYEKNLFSWPLGDGFPIFNVYPLNLHLNTQVVPSLWTAVSETWGKPVSSEVV